MAEREILGMGEGRREEKKRSNAWQRENRENLQGWGRRGERGERIAMHGRERNRESHQGQG